MEGRETRRTDGTSLQGGGWGLSVVDWICGSAGSVALPGRGGCGHRSLFWRFVRFESAADISASDAAAAMQQQQEEEQQLSGSSSSSSSILPILLMCTDSLRQHFRAPYSDPFPIPSFSPLFPPLQKHKKKNALKFASTPLRFKSYAGAQKCIASQTIGNSYRSDLIEAAMKKWSKLHAFRRVKEGIAKPLKQKLPRSANPNAVALVEKTMTGSFSEIKVTKH